MRIRLSGRPALGGAIGLLVWLAGAAADEARIAAPAARFRQPEALCLVEDGAYLLAANRRSGTISVIDTAEGAIVAEREVGRGLADLASLSDRRRLIAVDQKGGALILLTRQGTTISIVERLEIGPDPVSICLLPGDSSCVVASRWPRRLTFLAIGGEEHRPALKVGRTLDLPFSPRRLVATRDGASIIVADGFGGRLAVVDAGTARLGPVRSLPAHNIRGLALSPDGRTLAVAHQVLSPLARTNFDDVHWGNLMSNEVRLLSVDALLAPGPDADALRGGRSIDLDEVGHAAGDPGGIVLGDGGELIVALAGVGEIAARAGSDRPLRRTAVGRRPVAIVPGAGGKVFFVADALDDTISVVEGGAPGRLRAIALGPRPELDAAGRGERLFFDAGLSHDGWMSCQSCHTDGHTNGRLADTRGDGSYGAPKLVPSLLGSGSSGPWGWTGAFERIEAQVRQSIETTMQRPAPGEDRVADLAAYLRSLAAPPARDPAEGGDEGPVGRGRAAFAARGCAECHTPPSYTAAGRYDVGLADEVGNRRFNPPSLRGVGRRGRFLHDGRASALEEVFRDHAHPPGPGGAPPPSEVDDLVAFLKTL
jgi:mono/diheme cytochrome c family protein